MKAPRVFRERIVLRWPPFVLLALAVLLMAPYGLSQLVPGVTDVRWNEGAQNCATNPQPPLQVHRYNPTTFILRESLCATFEAPFMYLLVGSTKAILIDTGDVTDPNQMPLAKTVINLLPGEGSDRLPLLVVHTHRHGDHRAGDAQFARIANVEVLGFDIDSVIRYYNFAHSTDGLAHIDLGSRIVDVLPTAGHNETEVSFYDRQTGLFFSGDFLLPARLLINDTNADLASAERVAAFAKDHPISFVLGGHIEMNSAGELFPWESEYHPNEHVLQLTKDDVIALPTAIRSFNGLYAVRGNYTMMNSIRLLIAEGTAALVVVVAFLWVVVRYLRRRKRIFRERAETNV